MKRKIINIDEELCDGCGECVVGCSEGALQIIDGKAKLVKEDFCDGFGDCIGTCPTGALTIEEREAKDFDEEGVKKHLRENFGKEAVVKMEEAQKKHKEKEAPKQEFGGCPGMKVHMKEATPKKPSLSQGTGQVIPSELNHWPVQLHLVRPEAPFFKDKELVVLSTCSPVASADVHWRYLRGRSTVIACPKLDNTTPYAEKLSGILKEPSIPKVIIVRMEVPCCGGLTMLLEEALKKSGRKDVVIEEHVVGLNGELLQVEEIYNGKN